jgi:hypothetical protein
VGNVLRRGVYAMLIAVEATGRLRLGVRPPIESIPAAEYLRMITASLSSQIPASIRWARSRSISTRCGSPHANCGGMRLRHRMRCTSISMTTTLNLSDSAVAEPTSAA